MLRDVSTQWNSTFDMSDFVVEHEVVIDMITDKHKLGLSSYALDEKEWEFLRQVRDVLKVSCSHHVSRHALTRWHYRS